MQIQFDPRDPNACASVLATIAALHGSAAFDLARDKGYDSVAFGDKVTISGPTIAEMVEPGDLPPIVPLGETVDAAAAFGAPNVPTPPAPVVSPAPVSAGATIPTPPPAPSSGVELDADGLPWDARIHSGPADKKPKNSDGRWRRGRGVSDEQAAAVAAELRQIMGAPAPAPAAAPNVPVPPVAAPVAAAPVPVPPAPTPTPEPANTESGPAAATPAPSTFAELMKKVTGLQTAGRLTVQSTSEIAQALGLTGMRDMLHRPDLVPAFDALLPVEAA